MSPEREALLRENWKRFRPHARHMLSSSVSQGQLVMLIETSHPVTAYGVDMPISMSANRVDLEIHWDAVAEPYKSRGVRGCLVICDGVVLDRFDWGPP